MTCNETVTGDAGAEGERPLVHRRVAAEAHGELPVAALAGATIDREPFLQQQADDGEPLAHGPDGEQTSEPELAVAASAAATVTAAATASAAANVSQPSALEGAARTVAPPATVALVALFGNFRPHREVGSIRQPGLRRTG